jgi:hypothetical protein
VRSRWYDIVIAFCIVALGAAGVAAIWGDQLAGLFRGGAETRAGEAASGSEGQAATAGDPGRSGAADRPAAAGATR